MKGFSTAFFGTCQTEGERVIGCTACGQVFETQTCEKVPCEYQGGACNWCGGEETE